MPKPICVIKVNESINQITPTGELEMVGILQKRFEERFSDYHVLVLPTFGEDESDFNEPVQLQVFYDKDFTESNYKDLKEMIASEFENIKSNTNDAGKY